MTDIDIYIKTALKYFPVVFRTKINKRKLYIYTFTLLWFYDNLAYSPFLHVKFNNLVKTQQKIHFQSNLSFISASFCKMCCDQMIVYMLDYNFLVRVPCQLLPGTKYQQICAFFSIYVVKMTIFDCKYIKKVEKSGSQIKK